VSDPCVTHRIVNERGELVEMEMPPDVFADVTWWHRPRSWYGPVTQEQRRPAARARDPGTVGPRALRQRATSA
jgi:hypothetical protein